MTPSRNPILKTATTLFLGSITCLSAYSQTQPRLPAAFNHNLIVLDPAHGGTDTGAHLPDDLDEKDLNLAFAETLRPLLAAAGFTVVATRDSAPPTTAPPLTTDQRANTANHARALACILIHATASGSGIHISTSSLPEESSDEPVILIPWDTAQTSYLPQSRRLANELGVALVHAQIPTLLGRSSTRPLNNLTCPAVALEIAPLIISGSRPTPVSDSAYQQRIAQAITAALISWRTHIDPTAANAHPAEGPPAKPRSQATPALSTSPSKPATATPATAPSPKPATPAPQPDTAPNISKDSPTQAPAETPPPTPSGDAP